MNEGNIRAYYRIKTEVSSKEEFTYHSHDRYEIYYCHSGNCKFLIGDQIHYLQEDDIIIMNGLTLHRANPELGKLYERSVIEFSAEWVRPILSSLKVPELLNPFQMLSNSLFRGGETAKLAEIEDLMKRIAAINVNNIKTNASNFENRLLEGEVSALLVQLLFKIYELSKLRLVKIPTVKSDKASHANRIAKWIEQHLDSNITLDNIADNLNISKYYMSRVFKDVTGYTIMQYLMSCRINRAKYLLEMHPDKSILEVALESGFENLSHFSRFFRKQVKITPTDYRNSKAIDFQSRQIESR
ncbi:hypothetical protein WQ54_23390 [Bacillus sp. SA1-12]|uniref:AraC family transcriptional regulator n=1 Tax=Bacillus sp. SA1-12 TaxID=1455638 RepID=UPI000626F646|nr:AraC family transcriptional regulator [Bacillus sp. SA1-12]KKI90062.1 hypothetical protein WQ54_23390 [Bacillus sp. SA1-12]